MIKKFSWMIACWLLLLGAITAQAQEAAEGSAVKLGSGAVLKNTLIWGNKGKQLDGPAGTKCYIQAPGLASPKFLDSLNFDFRLSQGSPCWEQGEDQSVFGSDAVDLWGNKRVRGLHIDIGAHEYTTYEIHFIANSTYVKIEEVKHDDSCDSTHVEPNHSYSFKLNTDLIAGIEARDVIVKKLGENKALDPKDGGVYTLEKVNSDITVQIILTPPNEVAVKLPENGSLRVTEKEKGIHIPEGEGEAQKLSMMVAQDKLVVVDTVADEGYYCKEVWMEKKGGSKVSVKNRLGEPGIQITEAVVFSAEFAPNLYPLKLKINDAAMGKLSVSDGVNTYALPDGQTEWVKNDIKYAKDLSFTITATENSGYRVKSIKAVYSDGTSVDKTNATEKKALMKVGGVTIEVEFEGVPYYVSWNCTNGDLNVSPGTVESVSGGGKRVAVGYNQEITIVPAGADGYELVPNTLTATPDGGTAQNVTNGKWTVTKNTVLKAQFRKKKYRITVEAEPAGLLDFYVVQSGSLPADGLVEHGSVLVLAAKAVEGYVCSGIQVDGGTVQTGITTKSLPDIQGPHTVKFVFTRKAYTVAYTNTTPTYGTLKVESRDKDGGNWAELPANPGTVYYLDEVRATAEPNTHYHLKSLTEAGNTGTVINKVYTNSGVTEDLALNVEFAPDEYKVTVEKDLHTAGSEPGKGKIILKTGTHIWGTMDYTDMSFSPVDVPYGTTVTVEVQTQTNYACTGLTVNGTPLQPGGSFTVSGEMNVKALIISHVTKYKVTVDIERPQGSTSDLKVVEADGTTEVTLNTFSYDNNTALKVKKNTMSGEICLWVKANGSEMSGEDYTISNANVEFSAKFVKACTVRIVQPPHSEISVSWNGTDYTNELIVPQGVTLPVKIKAKTGTGCVYGCRSITVDGGAPLWQAGTVNPQLQPVKEHTYSLAIAETNATREITLGGTDMTFYEVQYAAANFGSLEVKADDLLIYPGKKYWYPENTKIGMTAIESVPGYGFNGGHKVMNQAVTPAGEFVLAPETTAGRYAYVLAALDRNLNLTALFEQKKYPVHLKVELPAGKSLADVGTVSMSGGDPVLTDEGTADVVHGRNVLIEAKPREGYAVQVKAGGEVKVSEVYPDKAAYTSAAVTAEVTYTVSFVTLYQVHYVADIAKVVREDGSIVANGAWAYAGEKLTAYSALPPEAGKECKSVTVAGFASPFTVYATNSNVLGNGTVECIFNMPEDNVRVNAVFDWKKYDLAYTLTPSVAGAGLQVFRVEGGTETSLAAGTAVLRYGDHLKVVIGLPPVEAGSADTWYEVVSCRAVMGAGNVGLTPSSSGLNRVYVLNATVTDDVNVTATLKRRTQNVILQVDPPNQGFCIRLQIDGGTAVEYFDAYREVAVPVGSQVKAWAQMTAAAPEGYELKYFPGTGKKEEQVSKNMPLHDNLLLAAKFTLKQYPLRLNAVPAEGGTILVQDDAGTIYSYNGSAVKYKVNYGCVLSPITVAATDAYFHLEGLTGYMGGSDRFAGQAAPYRIDKVVDSVGIEARFSRRYRVVEENVVANGSLEVTENDGVTAADGRFYPEKTAFTVKVVPADESYSCSYAGVYFPDVSLAPLALILDAEGNASYTIPEGLEAKDLVFTATFEKKKFGLVLKREPAEGGSAEVWLGERPGGTLLLQLAEGDTDLQTPEAEADYGSVLYFYTDPATPAYEIASKVTGTKTPYNGPVTLVSDTVFSVRYGRLYTLTFGPNVVVEKADGGGRLSSGVQVPEGTDLKVRAELTGHDCTGLKATKDGGLYIAWTDTDGVIEEAFRMPDGNVDIQGTFQPKKFKVKIVHQPDFQAFDVLQVGVYPNDGSPSFNVDRGSGSLAEYLSALRLDKANLQLHPWYEGPVTVTAVVKGDPTVYNLQLTDVAVKDSVTITATARRKQKTLTVDIKQEDGAAGNGVIVKTENGTQHTFMTDAVLTVDVGAAVEIRTVEGEGCKTVLLAATDGATTPVTNAPFTLNLAHMPDQNVTVTADFKLKRHPVYYTSNTGGRITVSKVFKGMPEGIVANSGDEVKHFTELTIQAVPESPRWRLKPGSFVTKMGGISVEDPASVASVTAAVSVEADFERVYEVRALAPDPLRGTLEVSRADTNAVGYRYPAGTVVQVKTEPKTGYEVVALKMNGEMQDFLPQGGVSVCSVPGNDPAVDSVEFEVTYALKKYKVTFIVNGQGVMDVGGLPGGPVQWGTGSVVRHLEHFTQLSVALSPRSEVFRITRFNVHLEDGSVIPVTAADTALEITGETRIEAEFKKYYWIEYTAPEHGVLAVKESDTLVPQGARYPGLTALDVRALPDEGYEVDYLTANGAEIVNNTVLLPEEDAAYDTVRIDTRFKIRQCQLTVVQPDSGFIKVERLGEDGKWVNLDVTTPLTLDYWSQIRIDADVYNPAGYEIQSLQVNGLSWPIGQIWKIRGDCRVEAVVAPRLYTVTYTEPEFGRLRVETPQGEIKPGDKVPYRTELTVTVLPDDPEGYEVQEVKANGEEIGNEGQWTVLQNTEIKAVIKIRRWEVNTFVTGEGSLSLYLPDGSALRSPSDIVDHYTVLKVRPVADPDWKLYTLDVDGAELQPDSTVQVTQNVEVTVVFRKKEVLLFPVAFTPNGDGYNDTWEISGLWQAPENTLEIFNRDQQSLYKVSPYMNEWGGTTDNGKILPAGTYIYKFTTGSGEEYMGLVSIVRN